MAVRVSAIRAKRARASAQLDSGHDAEELVSAVADDHVVRAEVRAQGIPDAA